MADGLLSMGYAIGASVAARRRATAAVTAFAVVVAVLFVLYGGRAAADDTSSIGRWFVLELRGSAFSRPAAAASDQWQSLRPGEVIAPGSIVRTGKDSNLLLVNRVDRMRLSPDSELELPAGEAEDIVTRVTHWIGTVFFDVGKRPSPLFEVTTPYLVAVVKGTAFTTTVSDAGSAIAVAEGIVGVAPARGGDAVDVAAGETASVSAGNSDAVSPGNLPESSASGQGGASADATGPSAGGGAAANSGSTARSGDGSRQGGGNGNGGDRNEGNRTATARGSGPDNGAGDVDDNDGDHGHGHGHGCRGGCRHDDHHDRPRRGWHGH